MRLQPVIQPRAIRLHAAIALCICTATATAQVFHLAIRGDLDSSKLARDAAAIVRENQSAAAIVLEIDANGWRPDVVHALAREIVDSRAPIGVLLLDRRDGRIGLGALMLALVSDAAVIDPRTKLESTPQEMLAAVGTAEQLERVNRELGGWLWVALDRAGLPPAYGEAMAYRDSSLDATLDGSGRWTLAPASPDDPAAKPFLVVADGAAGASADAELLRTLGLAQVGRQPRDVLDALEVRPTRTSRVEVRSELASARARVEKLVAGVDAARRDAQVLLDQHWDATRNVELPKGRIAEARARVLERIALGRRQLAEAEALFAEHPELVLAAAPVGTPVARDERQNIRDWRGLFLERRDDLDRLESHADRLD